MIRCHKKLVRNIPLGKMPDHLSDEKQIVLLIIGIECKVSGEVFFPAQIVVFGYIIFIVQVVSVFPDEGVIAGRCTE
jgi:hypothetical protein